MYILKNAFISITRNKGRNALIGIIILVIACACTITLAINNTATDLINSYDSAYQKELTISFDRKAMMENMDFSKENGKEEAEEAFKNLETYDIDDVKNFAESEHITSYYYTYSISLNGNNIDKAEAEFENEMGDIPGRGGMMGGNREMSSYDFSLMGYSSIDSMSEFINGTYTINEITDDAWDVAFSGNYVFINQELADYNNLALNDKIILEDEEGTTYEFEIIGIFEDNATENNSMMNMFSNSANTIVTNANILVAIDTENDAITGTVTPTFIIDSYDNKDLIQTEFYEKGLAKNYVVETNQEVAEGSLSSVKNVKSFTTTFLVITLIIGGVVLFILNMINIRERKYEIGVLRTIGVSKFKLTMQFVSELLVVAFIALMLGAGVGATMSKSVSNSLLQSEIENTEDSQEEMRNNFGGRGEGNGGGMPGGMSDFKNLQGVPQVEAYDSIDAVVNVTVLVELLAIGLTLVLISSIAAMISIQRFSPLDILKERS